jgi:peptidyl-prolyl cis-trans isomerase B (cyclophilin B)
MAKQAKITLADGEEVFIQLLPDEAPNTVANFEKLANKGFYDGLTFHRVIAGFVAQGGCPRGDGTGSAEQTIKCETDTNVSKHERGTLAMAHAGKDTGSCQFYIAYQPQPHLDGHHTVFGKVVSGMEHVDELKQGDVMEEVRVWEE